MSPSPPPSSVPQPPVQVELFNIPDSDYPVSRSFSPALGLPILHANVFPVPPDELWLETGNPAPPLIIYPIILPVTPAKSATDAGRMVKHKLGND